MAFNQGPRLRPADLAACRALLRSGSRSFFMASRLLPRRVRDDAVALYAFCRVADDAIDRPGGADALGGLHRRLALAYAGQPAPIAADHALADLVARCDIPMALPAALLEGFAWDSAGRRYADLPELLDYAVRVAGSVGAMMALLMGVRAPDAVARACDLGVAMQLSNIARDVGEDAQAGRLYLPQDWLRASGIDPDAWLANPVFRPALGGVVRRLLDEADILYARAAGGIAALPAGCRPGIAAAQMLYAEIGHQVRRNGGDSIAIRAVVPTARKLKLLARGFLRPQFAPAAAPSAPLPQAQFLIDAVADMPDRLAHAARGQADGRAEWVLALFARLEQAQRLRRFEGGFHGPV